MSNWTELPPITSWPNQVFNHENQWVFDVEKAVRMIHANPQHFQFGWVKLEMLGPQLDGRGNFDGEHIASMSDEDASRPVLFATEKDVGSRLIDGYHRAARCRRDGKPGVAAWILSIEQTEAIRQPYNPAIERI